MTEEEEIKLLDDTIKFLQRAQIQGAEAPRLMQIQQYLINQIRALQQPAQAEE